MKYLIILLFLIQISIPIFGKDSLEKPPSNSTKTRIETSIGPNNDYAIIHDLTVLVAAIIGSIGVFFCTWYQTKRQLENSQQQLDHNLKAMSKSIRYQILQTHNHEKLLNIRNTVAELISIYTQRRVNERFIRVLNSPNNNIPDLDIRYTESLEHFIKNSKLLICKLELLLNPNYEEHNRLLVAIKNLYEKVKEECLSENGKDDTIPQDVEEVTRLTRDVLNHELTNFIDEI